LRYCSRDSLLGDLLLDLLPQLLTDNVRAVAEKRLKGETGMSGIDQVYQWRGDIERARDWNEQDRPGISVERRRGRGCSRQPAPRSRDVPLKHRVYTSVPLSALRVL
jgi:hypothetical protein